MGHQGLDAEPTTYCVEGEYQSQPSRAMVRSLLSSCPGRSLLRVEVDVLHRYVRTPILPLEVQQFLDSKGVVFALVEDSCKAMLKIASDASINGEAIRRRITRIG
jgi:hypothetical protein